MKCAQTNKVHLAAVVIGSLLLPASLFSTTWLVDIPNSHCNPYRTQYMQVQYMVSHIVISSVEYSKTNISPLQHLVPFLLFDERRAFMQRLHLSVYKRPSYLCISCYIYCHLADSPINPQRSGEGRTERNNGCFYTQASKQQLACISRHISPMFLPRWSTPGVCGPPKSRDKQRHQFHITVSFVQKCSLSPVFLSLFMCDPSSGIKNQKVPVLKQDLSFCLVPLLGVILYFSFVHWGHFVH